MGELFFVRWIWVDIFLGVGVRRSVILNVCRVIRGFMNFFVVFCVVGGCLCVFFWDVCKVDLVL